MKVEEELAGTENPSDENEDNEIAELSVEDVSAPISSVGRTRYPCLPTRLPIMNLLVG